MAEPIVGAAGAGTCGVAVWAALNADSPFTFTVLTANAYFVSFVRDATVAGDTAPAIFVPVDLSTVVPGE
jgi:hypothetical protein